MPITSQILEKSAEFAGRSAESFGKIWERVVRPGKLSEALKSAPGFIKKVADPLSIAAEKRASQAGIREMIRGGELEIIHSGHSDETLAALGKAYEEMAAHPLRKLTRGATPKLILSKNNLPIPGDVMQVSAMSPAYQGKYIVIPQFAVDILTPGELKAVTRHEFGHFLQQDANPRRGFSVFRGMKRREHGADQIGAYLSASEHADLHTGMQKLLDYNQEKQELFLRGVREKSPRAAAALEWINKVQDKIGITHPPLPHREKRIAKTGAKMATEEGRSFVEEEITRRLKAIHQKLQPHHFDRPIDNARG